MFDYTPCANQVEVISDVEVFTKEYPLLAAVNRSARSKLYIQYSSIDKNMQCKNNRNLQKNSADQDYPYKIWTISPSPFNKVNLLHE